MELNSEDKTSSNSPDIKGSFGSEYSLNDETGSENFKDSEITTEKVSTEKLEVEKLEENGENQENLSNHSENKKEISKQQKKVEKKNQTTQVEVENQTVEEKNQNNGNENGEYHKDLSEDDLKKQKEEMEKLEKKNQEKQEAERNKQILDNLKNYQKEKFQEFFENFPKDETQYRKYASILFDKKELQTLEYEFLFKLIEYYTNQLREEKISLENLKILEELLYSKYYDNKGKFYAESKKYVKEANWDSDFQKYNFTRSDSTSNHLRVVQFFGEIGGFLYLFEYTKKTKDLNIIRQLLRIFIRTSIGINVKMLKEITILLKDYIYQIMNELTEDELKNETKVNLRDPLFYVTVLLRKALPFKESTEISEFFNLNFSLKIFNTECDLEKRLFCLADIKKIIKETTEKKTGNSMTVKNLHQWMEANDFLNSIFSKDLHAELLRKKFTESDFEIIWKSFINKHETTQRNVLDFILRLLPMFEINLFDLIFQKIENHFDLNDLLDFDKFNFLKEITKIYFSKFKKKKNFGLELLWNLFFDFKSLDENLAKNSLKALKEILILDDFESQRKKYMKLCLDNIRDHCSIPQSINLLMNLMNTYPSNGRKKKNVIWSVLDNINERILDLFFLDLDVDFEYLNYDQQESEKILQETKKITIKEFNEKYISEKKSFITKNQKIDILNIKLKFITFVLYNSNFKLNLNQLKLLWEKFYKEEETKNIFIEWFNSLLKSEADLFQDLSIEHFFDEILSNLKEWKEIEFDLFCSFFNIINREKGMKMLWKLNLETDNEDVLKKSIKFLNSNVQENSNFHIQQCIEKIKSFKENEKFLIRTIDILYDYILVFKGKIRGHSDNSGVPIHFQIFFENKIFQISLQTEDKLENILLLTSNYLKYPLKLLKFFSSNGDELKDKNQKLIDFVDDSKIYLQKINFNYISIQLLIRQFNYLGLNEISNVLQHKYQPSNKPMKPKEIEKKQEEEIIETISNEIPIKNDKTKPVEKKMDTKKEKKVETEFVKLEAEIDPNLAVNILQTQDNFSILFSLLDLSDDVASSVWKILKFLPTNKEIYNSIKNLNETINWEEVISIDNSHKLLYQLQIIDGLSRRNTLDESFNLDVWNQNFIKFGGIKHLIKILLNYENMKIETLSLLLNILNTFKDDEETKKENLTKIISKIFKEKKINYELVQSIMLFTLNSLKINANCLDIIYENDSILDWFKNCLLDCDDVKIRNIMSNYLILISEKNEKLRDYLFEYFFKLFETIEDYSSSCESYFNFLEKLIEKNKLLEDEESEVEKLIAKILSKNFEVTSKKEDLILIGYLNILTSIFKSNLELKKNRNEFLIQIYNSLFQIPNENSLKNLKVLPPKCKSKKSRKATFQLIVELINKEKEEDEYKILLTLLKELINESKKTYWFFTSSGEGILTKKNFIGLKNAGSTCYMNSLLQQFYMIPVFRNGMFSAKVPTVEETKDDDNKNVLYQSQLLFGNLKDSFKYYYDTNPFCDSYKDIFGEKINVHRQQDAYEFFNLYFDKIEAAIGNSSPNFVKSIFGGRVLSEIKTENYVSKTEEPIIGISLDVKNKKNIQESLDNYIKGDRLEGENQYYSEHEGRHVDAVKTYSILKLPEILTLHLKRFEFDYERRKNNKINDRLEFPRKLDLFPYTVDCMKNLESSTNKNYQYELVGVVVHIGTADSGHYYSFIMERSTRKWYEFNDTKVIPFDIENLDKECFGGVEEIVSKDQNGTDTVKNKILRTNNAYMLFYQKTSSIKEEEPLERSETKEEEKENIQEEKKDIEVELPSEIKKIVWKENGNCFRDEFVYSEEFNDFILQVLSLKNNQTSSIELCCKYLIDILSHSIHKSSIEYLNTLMIRDLLSNNKESCKFFLNYFNQENLISIFFDCPHEIIRNTFKDISIHCLKILSDLDETTTKFVSKLIELIQKNGRYYYRNIGELIQLFEEFAELSFENTKFLLSKEIISILTSCLHGGESTIVDKNSKLQSFGLSLHFGKKCLFYSLKLISWIMRSCETSTNYVNTSNVKIKNEKEEKIYLSDKDKEKFFNRNFFGSIIQENVNLEEISNILTHWCFESRLISINFSNVLINQLTDPQNLINTIGNSSKTPEYISGQEPFLQILQSILNIDDSIKEARASEIIKNFIGEVIKNKSNASSTLTCLKFLVNPKHSDLIKKILSVKLINGNCQ
eukprot:gene1684-453_t